MFRKTSADDGMPRCVIFCSVSPRTLRRLPYALSDVGWGNAAELAAADDLYLMTVASVSA